MNERQADKRDRIVEAAIDVFCSRGFEGASMAEIAERADVAKGTLYLYFTSKEQLAQSAFWKCHRADLEACQQGLDELPGAIAKLERRLENVTRWALKNPRLIRMERLYCTSPVFGKSSRYQHQYLHFEAVDRIIRDGLEAGELKQLPSPLLGEMFFGIGAAALNYLTETPEAIDDDDFWRACRECVAGCLKKTDI